MTAVLILACGLCKTSKKHIIMLDLLKQTEAAWALIAYTIAKPQITWDEFLFKSDLGLKSYLNFKW